MVQFALREMQQQDSMGVLMEPYNLSIKQVRLPWFFSHS